jgi:hypothetical protein
MPGNPINCGRVAPGLPFWGSGCRIRGCVATGRRMAFRPGMYRIDGCRKKVSCSLISFSARATLGWATLATSAGTPPPPRRAAPAKCRRRNPYRACRPRGMAVRGPSRTAVTRPGRSAAVPDGEYSSRTDRAVSGTVRAASRTVRVPSGTGCVVSGMVRVVRDSGSSSGTATWRGSAWWGGVGRVAPAWPRAIFTMARNPAAGSAAAIQPITNCSAWTTCAASDSTTATTRTVPGTSPGCRPVCGGVVRGRRRWTSATARWRRPRPASRLGRARRPGCVRG